ncbi:hypothetical protein OIU84_010547 [Salix udensis]|uniref:Uncharacterized protein n=1 Tax=Salix udensis TaxID=889485 RepID=A0AAD6NVM7_9ROSI|nr:hypothetical protein OIU84_010547 [Salix udensis]
MTFLSHPANRKSDSYWAIEFCLPVKNVTNAPISPTILLTNPIFVLIYNRVQVSRCPSVKGAALDLGPQEDFGKQWRQKMIKHKNSFSGPNSLISTSQATSLYTLTAFKTFPTSKTIPV